MTIESTYTLQPDAVTALPLDLIDFDPEQPRQDVDPDYLADLSADIKQSYVKQPITVRPNEDVPGRFIVVYGECRTRASRIAGKDTIPSLIDMDEDNTGITRLLNQVKENHLRKDLNPMEWAGIFKKLRSKFKLKVADIIPRLEENGINNIGREQISNITRLLDLPDWAQTLIKNGEMKPAHGKYLLMATSCSDTVTAALEQKYTEDNWRPTTRELHSKICDLFNTHHQRLANPGYWQPFDQQHECKGCKNKKKVTNGIREESLYCLDTACYQQKKATAEAEEKRQQEIQEEQENQPYTPPVFEIINNNQVDTNSQQLNILQDWRPFDDACFDLSGCEDCERNLEAVDGDEVKPACFNTQCFQQKQSANNVDHRLTVEHLKTCCANRIASDDFTVSQFFFWLAATSPEGVVSNDSGEYIDVENYIDINVGEMEKTLFKHSLFRATDFFENEDFRGSNDIVRPYIMAINNQTLIEVCNHFNITVDGYRINKDYIESHTPDELERLCHDVDLSHSNYNTLGDEGLLNHADAIGVPAGIQWAWQQLTAAEAS